MPHNLSPFNSQFSPPAARHYHPTLSIWLSVDPLADKYPGVSPYVYCGNNPIVLKDPDGRVIAPSNKEGKDAIENYFNKFSKRTQNRAFGLKRKPRPDDNNGTYTYYSSSHPEKLQAKDFYKRLGRGLSPDEKQEAYAVYTALMDEGLYTVGVWGERKETESYSYQAPSLISEGTKLFSSMPGYATPAVSQNRAYDLDMKNIANDNFTTLFSTENHRQFNGTDIFTPEYNFYVNYGTKELSNNYEKSIGCLIFNGIEGARNFGKAFHQIIFY